MLADTKHSNQYHKTLNNQVLEDQLKGNNIAWNKLKLNLMLSGFICLGMYHFTMQEGEKHFKSDSPRPSEYEAILLAGQAHSGGVNDGHKPLDVWQQHPIEELFVAVLEPH